MAEPFIPGEDFRSGYIAVVGRPNVGKSTLINHMLGQKISITSRKPQTTRHQILGIKTDTEHQAIYVDTPGLHTDAKRAINRYMNRAAAAALQDVDLIVMLVEALKHTPEDDFVIDKLAVASAPVILVVNKIDRVKKKEMLLPFLEEMSALYGFSDVVPMSAKTGKGLDVLEGLIRGYLPKGELVFPEEYVTDRSMRFIAAEIIREKLIRRLGDELPYRMTVEIENYEETPGVVRIAAVIWVERKTHKSIVIGKGGQVLKQAGIDARADIERMVDKKVFLETWVKVKERWTDDENAMRSFGYEN